jgi:hypothetical protein
MQHHLVYSCFQGSLAYRIVFECPNGHSINLQKKCGKVSLSETEAMKLFGGEELCCPDVESYLSTGYSLPRLANCGWRGKASEASMAVPLSRHLKRRISRRHKNVILMAVNGGKKRTNGE